MECPVSAAQSCSPRPGLRQPKPACCPRHAPEPITCPLNSLVAPRSSVLGAKGPSLAAGCAQYSRGTGCGDRPVAGYGSRILELLLRGGWRARSCEQQAAKAQEKAGKRMVAAGNYGGLAVGGSR